MKIIKFLVAVGLLTFLCLFLDSSFKVGDKAIPALGKILSPSEGFWANVRSMDNFQDYTLASPLLKDHVEIILDERLVPHIYATNLADALFAQGYIMAKHRLFQMDLGARSAEGRLAEILGEKLLETDKMHRNIGMDYAAENASKSWKTFDRYDEIMMSYVAGINSYIDQLDDSDLPLEYKLIGAKPESWTVLKSAYFLKSMALVLGAYEDDVRSTNALHYFGPEQFDLLYPDRTLSESPVIPSIYRDSIGGNKTKQATDVPYANPLEKYVSPKGIGSNNWAVSGQKTASGFPILCNDPHLKLSLPSIWHEIHIHIPEGSAYGVCLPGMPGIMIGFNKYIAWGETNVGHDVMDYLKIDWVDDSKDTYRIDGKIYKTEKKVQEYNIRGKPEGDTDTILYTIYGPVPSSDSVDDEENYALRWLAHDTPDRPEYITFVDGMFAKNYDEYKKATFNFLTPAQNFAFAAKDGDIALRINGKLPVKTYPEGRFLKDGSTKSNDWQGFIPREENPQIVNPERNYISSANQYSADASYPYYYNGRFEAFRGRILNRLLDSMTQITASDMMALQANTYNLKAEETLPILLDNLAHEYRDEEYYTLLTKWNYEMDKNVKGPYFYDAWFYSVHQILWDEVSSIKDSIDLSMPKHITTVKHLKIQNNPYFDFVDTRKKEGLQELVTAGYLRAKSYYNDKGGTDTLKYYGDMHQIDIEHLLKIPAFSENNIATNGSGDVLNAISTKMGPSWRMIVELGDHPNAYGIYPGGQSGEPGSKYYKNMIEKWVDNQYDTLIFPQDKSALKTSLYRIKLNAAK